MSDVTLLIHPFNNDRQVLWLCDKLREQADTEISQVNAHDAGTVINVSVTDDARLLNFLNTLTEVVEVQGETMPPPFPDHLTEQEHPISGPQRVIYVAISPFSF